MSTFDNKPGAVLPNLMQLEQRLMFDGAAVEASIDSLADHADDLQVVEAADDMFSLAVAYGQTQQATEQAQQQIKDYLENASAEELFQLFNGGKDTLDAQWLQSMEALRQSILSGEYQVRVEFLDNETIKGGLGAFAAEGKDGEPTIYLNRDWVEGVAGEQDIVKVLVEELGHSIDSLVNAGGDTVGDEGEAFAAAVAGTDQDGVISTDASATLDIDGEAVEVEFATYDFQTAYEIVVDIESDGEVQDWIPDENFEYAIDKESNTHNFIYTTNGLGSVTVIDDTDSRYFSGNDVSAIGINIGGETYFGWISRPIKVQGEVKGFYFWTDTEFVDFATAQADGNQDGDSNTVDNRGFILAVDKAYFDGLGFVSRSGVASDTYKVIGSSSDRVDNALNALIPDEVAPVAGDDSDTASEAGGLANNTLGADATGNVLGNDTDANSDSLSVTQVVSNGTTNQSTVTDITAGVVTGLYGELTLQADGTYIYSVDNANPQVEALRTSGNTLAETFNYTITDGNGGVSAATLTITVEGANDTPEATGDYNTAKESTTQAVSGDDITGYSATGNVLDNDTDVDQYGETANVLGLASTGTVGSVTLSPTITSLTFVSEPGFTSVSAGRALYYPPVQSANDYRAVYDSSYNLITIGDPILVDSVTDTYNIPLSGDPAWYSDGANGFVAITAADMSGLIVGFENSTNPTENSASMKTASVNSTTTTGTSVVTFSSYQGSVSTGMTVSGAGVPAGTTVTDVTYDANGDVVDVTLSSSVTTSASDVLSFFAASGTTVSGAHGDLVLNSDGSYTYTPWTDNPNLAEGESAIELFTYNMADASGAVSTATLEIVVYGTGSNDPVTNPDMAPAAQEDGLTAGTSSTGNVLSNDQQTFINAGAAGVDFIVSGARSANSASDSSVSTNTLITGAYGTLLISADGSYTYTPDDSNPVVDALQYGDTLNEVFYYTITNAPTSSSLSIGSLTVTINGTNDAPAAADDVGTAQEQGGVLNGTSGYDASGNVLVNDTDVDSAAADLSIVSVRAGSTEGAGAAGIVGGATDGSYGTLTLNADGSWTYVVDESNPAIAALNIGETLVESFNYTVSDNDATLAGTDTAVITITINGANDTVSVNNLFVNEASPFAIFTVTGAAGTSVTLNLSETTGISAIDCVATLGTDTAAAGTLEYYNGTEWLTYTGSVVIPTGDALYVRLAVTQDGTYEGNEVYSLTATANGVAVTGLATINDEGEGDIFLGDNNSGAPNGTGDAGYPDLDDDRPTVSISNPSVMEGNVAQFSVTLSNPSTEDISFTPELNSGTATLGTDTVVVGALEVSTDGGNNWTTVSGPVTIAAGQIGLLLRIATTDDSDLETAEHFTLSTGYISGTVSNVMGVTGTATIGDNDAANTPPELADTNLTLTVAEDAAAPTGAVGSLLGDFTGGISDADGGALKGIAVTGIDASKGTWYYSLDDGATWSEVGAVSETSALLLADDGSTRLYFQPTPNFNGDVASGLTFKAWDRTEGTAGTKVDTTPADATSSYTSTGGIVIPSTGSGSITELSTLDISGLTGTLADINVTLNGLSHTWPQDMDILLVGPEGQQVILMSDAGGEGTNAISDLTLTFDDEASSDLPPAGSALSSGAYKPANLIDNEDSSDLDSFDGISGSFASQLAAFDGTDPNGTWTLYIADDVATDEGGSLTNWTLTLTMSGQGSPFSTATDTISVSVTAVNDAPLASGSSSLPSISEDSDNPPGDTVANLFTPNFDDQTDEVSGGSSANTLAGIAIIDYTEDTGKGQWQYSTDAGGSWTTLGSISGDASSLTLDATTMMRFVPAADYHGDAPDVTVRLIDSSTSVINAAVVDVSNNGGITAVSADTVLLSTSVTAVNDLPTGTDDSVTTPEDIPVVLAADDFGTFADVDGDTLVKVQISTLETSGSLEYFDGTDWNPVTLNQEITKADIDAGKLRFVPGTDENGSPYTTVGFKVSDGTAYSADAYTLTVNVTPENDDFTDDDEILNVNEDSGETTGTLLSGTSSVDGPVTVKSFTIAGESGPFTLGNAYSVAGKGAITVNADGSYSFTPAANWNGAFPVISYVVTDGSGTDDTSTLTINVDPVNDDFTDDNEILNVNEDSGETSGNLLSGTSSVDGPVTVKSFTIAGESGPFTLGSAYSVAGKGMITVNADGSYSFTPAANWNGAFPVVSYVVTDGSGTDDTSTLTITVDPVNDDFTDDNEILNVNEDSGETSGNLLSGTSSVDGPVTVKSFTIAGESGPFTLGSAFSVAGKGTVTVNTDGSYSFTPAANWNGAFPVISYVVTDGSGTDDTSTLTITVDPVNDDFTDDNEILNVNEDSGETSGNLLSGTSSVDGPVTVKSFTIAGESGPFTLGSAFSVAGKGTVTVTADGSYSFTPAANWNGAFPVISYVVTDGSGTDDTSTLTITVDPVNDDFTDDNEILNVNEDSGETSGNLLSGTSSVDGPVTVKSFTIAGESGPFTLGNAFTVAGKGTVTVTADGSYSFTPAANWNGAFPVVSYVVTDGSGTDDTSTLTITVSPVADVPEFVDESGNPLGEDVSVTTREDTPVNGKLHANDPDGDDLTFEKASDPANGTVTVDEDGNWTYTPDPDYNGNDSFTVVVRDPAGNTDTITVSITVTPENDAPVLVDGNGDPLGDDQSVITPEDTPVSGQLEAEDVDGDDLTFSKTTDPANGTVTVNPDGSWEYTPNPGYSGNDSFTVTVSDGEGGTDTLTVNVEVTPKPVVVPPAPVAPAPSADIPPPPPAEVAEAPKEAPAVELDQPVQTGQILVQRDIPEQTFASSNGITLISFSIPSDTFGHTEPGAEITLSAVLSDGRPIPDWLVFDPEKGEFRGVAPKGFDGTLIIRVIARDQNGDQVETMVTIQVRSEQAETAEVIHEGKGGLMQQLQTHNQFAWKAERDRLIELARAAAEERSGNA